MCRDLMHNEKDQRVSCQGCEELASKKRGGLQCSHAICPKGRTEPESEYKPPILPTRRRR